MSIEFEWNDVKSESNFEKHGVRFEEAKTIWTGPSIEIEGVAKSKSGEERKATFGKIQGEIYAVIWTWRQEKIRIISARKARDYERQVYTSYFQN